MGLSNCITKARDAIKKSAKKQRNQAMRSGAPDTSEQFAETQEKALVGLIARIGDVQALDGDNQAAADAIRSAIEDLMLDREALAIQVERAGLEMPAAPDVAVAEKADQPSEMESAVIENSTVSISLSPESARDVRIDRIVASQPNPADRARMRGFYDEMLGIPSRVGEYSKISAVSYEQGRKRGMDRRNLLNGRPWYEVEKVRDGSRWKWVIYQEGVFKRSGSAKSEKEADLAIDIARVELTEQADQPGAETVTAPAEAEASNSAAMQDVSEPSGKEQTSLPDRIRRIVGLDQAKLDAYIPESAVSKLGNKWVYDLYGGNRSQDMLDTKKEAIDRATRHKKLLQDQYDRPESYWDIASLLASKRLERIESYMRQGIPEMEAGRRVREEIPDDWTPPEVADDEAPKVENQNVAPLSSVINKVNAKNDEDLTEADRIATVESHSEFTDRLNDGNVTIDEFKARFESVKKSKDALIAELGKKTKPELLAILGGHRADRMKNDKKDRIVNSVYTSMLDDFVLGNSISYSFGSKYEDVIGGYVARYGQADIDAYAERIKASRAEREQRAEKIAAAVKDPQDFAEYQVYIKAKLAEGMTLQQARMSLPAEKRAMFDNEMAEASRNARGERKEVAKTQVQAAAQTTAGQLFESKHTKTGEPLFVVKTADRVDRDIYNQWNATAKRLGGYYSSYRGNGAIPGFTFKTKEGAEAFMQYLGGDTVAAQDAIKTDRDAFADDRSQSAVERLNEMADRLDANADSVLSADRKTNTERRARFAASAEAAANSNKAMAQTMRNIAKSISEGTAKFLDMVRQKAQVEMLRSKLQTAKQDEAKAQDPNGWYTKELHKKPATVETADFATWPTYTAYRSDLAQMGRALLQLDGGKRLGQSVLKVADDVTNAYKAFAKENLYKVSTFKTSDGGPAVFSTADKAEEAIARSGFKGKATTISFKRGEHLVIMGPQMARENGIWQGDDDQRITLAPDFAEQIVAFNKSLNKRTQDIRMPWVFDNVAQERARWKAMGIETPAEMRAALREFVSLNEQAKEVDKIKQMERAMIGRRNDGLDFFPTSQDVVQQMLESAEIEPGMSVLEPSAGMGHIADQIRASGVDPDVIELSGDRRELLEAKGFNVIGSDFTELKSRDFTYGDVFRAPDGTLGVMRGSGGLGSNRVGLDFLDENGQADRRRSGWYARDELVGVEKRAGNSGYDRIIMNPPFSNRRDAEHVQHAYTLLRPGGRIVAIMGEGVFFGQDKKAVEFREWLESVGGTSEKLPEGSFLDPSLPVNTSVNARMVVIDKQDTATAKTDSGIALLSPSLGRVDADKVDVATARAVVSGLLAGWRNAPNSSVVATASDLPVVVREELANQGEKTARGVYHGGTFYLVADEHSTEAEIEETVFHEVWAHYGLRSMFGAQTTTKLAAVFDAISASGFMGLPEKDAFRAFSRRHGFETAQTETMLRKGETFDPRFTEAVKKRILVEELIAKVQEKGAPDTLKRKALEIIGAIREWLRSVGFGHLMKYSDADLMRLVQRARDTVVYGKPGSAGKGNSPAVLMRVQRSPSAAETITIDGANPDIRYNAADGDGFVSEFLSELAAEDAAFRYPVSKSKTIEGNIADAMPGAEYLGEDTRPDEKAESMADRRFAFKTPGDKTFYVFTRGDDEVWIDVSRLEPGDQGSAVYHGVANYAYNTGKVFIGDPNGLSEDAIIRRTSAMLSSALRFGTTRHIAAADEQMAGAKKNGIPPLSWTDGDDVANLKALIDTYLSTLQSKYPGIKNARYDFGTGQFIGANDLPIRRGDGPGSFDAAAASGPGRASRAGEASLRRGILIQSLASSESSERPGLLELVLSRSSQLVGEQGGLGRVFSQAAGGKTSATDQSIYVMAEEGRSVGEILDYIAASSSSPFNRALAGLLKTAGVKTKITVGGSTGWALNSGEGGKFSAGYNPASDTAALFRSQAAERNILHELVHAATLTALERNGLASSKMKALFAHVKRSGKLDGTYGMTSIDEFAAEVFTNPKFQDLLKTIEAAPINGKKARSAWDWFVGIVRGILGMEAGQDNALSQALEIGVAVMEENTAMRDGKVAFTEITGKEIDAMPGNTLQSKATNWLRQNLQGKTVVNDSTGWEISTGRKGINKAMSHSGTESVARSVAAIPDLLKNAVLVQTEQNNNASERDDVPWVHHFYAPVRIGGADYVARIVVKEAKDGTRFYDYDTSNEISPADPDSTLPFSQRRGAEPGARPAMSMSELLSYVKEEHGGKDSRFTPGKTLGKVRAMADEDTVSGTSIRRGTAEEAQANGFTMRAYRGVSAASPFNDSGTVWLTTSRSAAESYATEVFGYEDPEVIEVWVKPDQIPVWDMRKVSDEELETLNPDEFGNPQNIGIYRNSDDSMLGGSGAGTVIHAPVESIFVIDDEAAGRIRYNVADDGWSVAEQARAAVLRMAGRPMLDAADPFAAENARLREQDESLWSKAKTLLRRYLAPGGLLPKAVFDEKIKRDSEFQAVEFDVRHLIGGLERAVKADYGMAFDKLSHEQMRPITEALAGNVPDSLPDQTKVAALAMRQYIDSMSTEYLKIIQEKIDAKMLKAMESGKDADVAQVINEIELFEKIKGNIGHYVHRSYQAFDDPKWFEKVPADALNAARDYLRKGYLDQGEAAEEAARLAEVSLYEILKNGTAYDSMESFIAEGKLGAKDLSVLMRRKEVPKEIRDLLGEYPDARLNFTKSATKMGRLIWNSRFLDRVRDIGLGSFFFEGKDRPPAATTQIAAEGSEVYAPLNGLWTFPEVAQAFKDALGKEQMSDLYRAIVRANGIVKYGKTVLSPTTAMRNWQSAMFFSLANGHFDLTQMKKSISAFREQVAQTATGNDLKYLRHLKQLGVVYDTPYAGEMARLMEDARMEELLSSEKGDAVRWFRKANQLAQGFYTFGDDFWKIIGFENEKAGLMKAGLSLQDAEIEAAKRIRDTYPTYSMVGRGIQWLSRFPLAGTFVSFPAEIIRTSANMVRTVAADLKSDNPKLRELGMRRAAGMVFVSAAFYSLAALSKALAGVDDDEEEAIRDLAPQWSKNSTFLYLGRDEKGQIRYFDLSFLDPYGYFKRPLTAMMRDQPWEESLSSSMSDLLTPFFGVDISAGAIFEAVSNKKESGGRVYNENDGVIDQTIDIADHMRKALQPGIAGNVERLVKASLDVKKSSGQAYDLEDEMVALLGWRASTINPKTALHYRSFAFTDALTEARREITSVMRSPNSVSEDDVRDAYAAAQRKQDEAFRKMSRIVLSAEAAGMSRMEIMRALRTSNIAQRNITALLRGQSVPVSVSSQAASKAIRQAGVMNGPEFAQEVRDRFRHIPKSSLVGESQD